MFSFFRDVISDEKKLVQMLLARYAKLGIDGRPVKNSTHAVSVVFGLGLIKMELHERENVLELSTWARYVSIYGINLIHMGFNPHASTYGIVPD